jgi:hypothetical protein
MFSPSSGTTYLILLSRKSTPLKPLASQPRRRRSVHQERQQQEKIKQENGEASANNDNERNKSRPSCDLAPCSPDNCCTHRSRTRHMDPKLLVFSCRFLVQPFQSFPIYMYLGYSLIIPEFSSHHIFLHISLSSHPADRFLQASTTTSCHGFQASQQTNSPSSTVICRGTLSSFVLGRSG